MLKSMGANIEGIGSHLLKIEGVTRLKVRYKVIPDRIEAGTYILAAVTGGDVVVEGIDPSHLGSFLDLLRTSGLRYKQNQDSI